MANDQQENQLWMNQRDGTFRNLALLAGVALGGEGTAKADISVDFGDFDNDGDEDLFVTELTGQGARSTSMTAPDCSRTGARRQGSACPACRIPGSGRPGSTPTTTAGSTSSPSTAGSCTTATRRPTIPFRWISGTSFCGNLGDGRFEDVTGRAGAVFELSEVSRGAGFGDIDNDGDTDVAVTNAAGPVRLLLNGIGSPAPLARAEARRRGRSA